MREQEVRELYEAYLQVHQPQEEVEELNEGRTTSLSALSRESQKRKEDKERGRPETESETHSRLAMGKFRPGASQEERAEGGRQVLKDRGKVPKKGGKDMFEHILEHLVSEGYADTEESALAIMANMSEEWRESIVEDFPNVLNFPSQGGSRSGDAGTRGLKMIQTPGGQRGYINKHSGGEILPSGTVNKIMGGNLMVKNQNPKSNIKTA
jgi:hypothetical protein